MTFEICKLELTDTPKDATQALEFGAQGIGLVRTEHMFLKHQIKQSEK